jgi:predicted Zn-dependent peptidase
MLRGFTIGQVRAFHAANFGAGRTHVYVCGRFDAAEVEQAVRKGFADWPRGNALSTDQALAHSTRAAYLIDRPGAPQSTLYLGLPVLDPSMPEYRAFSVMNALLGGSFSSRITANIREDKGYTYSPYSTVSARYRSAYWLQVADVSTDVTGASIKEILFEINRLRTEPPAEQELKAIQNYLAGVFVIQNSSPTGIINQLTFMDLHGLPESYLSDAVRNIHAVTPEKVRSLAAEYLKDDGLTLVVVGDRKKVAGQVRQHVPIAR